MNEPASTRLRASAEQMYEVLLHCKWFLTNLRTRSAAQHIIVLDLVNQLLRKISLGEDDDE